MNPREYLQEVSKEMQKVSWPDRDELVSNTIIVVIGTIFISGFIYLSDQVITTVLDFLYA
jgi:preprotein translocase subunit SecE